MTKSERGRALRQSILNQLNKRGPLELAELAIHLREPRKVVLGHLNIMVAAEEVARWPLVFMAMARKTKVKVHGGAVRDPLKPSMVNRCMYKPAIKNQCADSRGPGPRQAVGRGIFGL
jgi:hypothetical protein